MPTWIEPVPGNPAVANGGQFGAARPGGRIHEGVDLEVSDHTPIYATADGIVTFTGLSGLYGGLCTINHAAGHTTLSAHCSKFAVTPGTHVSQGQLVAYSGGSRGEWGAGDATGPHLHFEHHVNGKPVDPVPFWKGNVPVTGSTDGTIINRASQSTNPLDAFSQIAGWVSTPGNWVRIGLFTLGAIILLIVSIKLLSETDAGKTVTGVASKAAEIAAVA